jgi:NAD(P)-dependent dehydrogenase (short-subunit alcohol dehydrogenase family)
MRALVTGANRGLGEGVARRLVTDGHDVMLMDLDDAVHKRAAELGALRDGVVESFVGDVSDEATCERLFARVVERFGGLDVLVNIAGIGGPSTSVVETPLTAFRRTLEVNLVGTFLTSRTAANLMIAQGIGGCIINTSSLFAQQGVAHGAAYCASKAGVSLLTQSMALELAPHGIRVNAVAPGNMATEMHWDELRMRAELNGTTFEQEQSQVRSLVPLGRFGTSEDIAGFVAWLISPDSSYVTGQTIGVNGGVFFS